MPSRSGHLLSLTSECISVARLASVSIMNSAHSATEGELAVPATISGTLRRLRAGTSTASNPTPILVTTSMSLEDSSSGSPKRVPPRATPWTGACSFSLALKSACEIMLGNSTSSMSSRAWSSALPCCDIDSVTKIFFLLVAISCPWVSQLRRQRTTPVTSFSRCMLLRSTANRSGPPSCAPALGLTRPQTCAPSIVK